MILYITEKRYESYYDKWQKSQGIDKVDLSYYLEQGIRSHAKGMAATIAYGGKIKSDFYKNLIESARFWILRAKFEKTYVVSPTQPGGIIPVDSSIGLIK